MVTFSKRMESRGKTEGERGVLLEKICNVLWSAGSEKDGASVGLCGVELEVGFVVTRGGKSAGVKSGWI